MARKMHAYGEREQHGQYVLDDYQRNKGMVREATAE